MLARAQDPAPKGFQKAAKGKDAAIWSASMKLEWDGAQARDPPTFSEGHSIKKVLAQGHKLQHRHTQATRRLPPSPLQARLSK